MKGEVIFYHRPSIAKGLLNRFTGIIDSETKEELFKNSKRLDNYKIKRMLVGEYIPFEEKFVSNIPDTTSCFIIRINRIKIGVIPNLVESISYNEKKFFSMPKELFEI